ncbi:MAG: YfiR family protein [Nitrosomonas sp.]|uniref:YfiR family protein n=1 Tax=Nitrosomonas sp. TaxID=42353 RepID=UPI0032EFB2C4
MMFYIASIGFTADVQADEAAEYMLKAAFLYNFAIFTTWPDRTTDNFNLCIYGKDPFSQDLDSLMRKKHINDRKVIIHRINIINRLSQCQMVFISRAAIGNLTDVIDDLKDKPVLTVADSPGVSQQGVVLNMNVKDDKITFEANLTMARKAGLSLSSQLLRLATKVQQ